jgi:ABC-type cobalamin/Fe3+-siderophores transport system ATPase subunit
MIHVDQVSGGYDGKTVLKEISLSVERGQLTGIIGPNGSGKTTLMKMLSGVMKPLKGTVYINHRNISSYSSKELARTIAVLPQNGDNSFDFTVREVVGLGRYPYYKGWLKQSDKHDEEMIYKAMELTDVKQFASFRLQELSGGERQRVFLAKALAQDPEILLLDEPTNHLDLSNQMKLMDLLKMWNRSRELTVVAILHDLNLASLYCDNIYMLNKGTIRAGGVPSKVMDSVTLQDVYEANLLRHEHPKFPRPLISLNSREAGKVNSFNDLQISQQNDRLVFSSNYPFKTLSSTDSFKWIDTFIFEEEHVQEFGEPDQTIRFKIENVNHTVISTSSESFGKIYVVACIGTTNEPFTIAVFLQATLTEASYLQIMLAINEAIHTPTLLKSGLRSNICIASTQTGEKILSATRNTNFAQTLFKLVTKAIDTAKQKGDTRSKETMDYQMLLERR